VQLQGPGAVLAVDADEALLDAPEVHLPQGHAHGVDPGVEVLVGHVLEHVLGREAELLLGFLVLGLPRDEGVELLHVGGGEPDHRVDDPDVERGVHAPTP
jgi:hypothetical protein